MGRYYDLANHTKKQVIEAAYYWKGTYVCNCHEVMHQFKWDKSDEITSFACYKDDYFPSEFHKIEYNEETNEMFVNDKDVYNNTNELELYNHFAYDYNVFDRKDNYDHIPIWNDDKCTLCGYIYTETKLKEYSDKLIKLKRLKELFA